MRWTSEDVMIIFEIGKEEKKQTASSQYEYMYKHTNTSACATLSKT